MANNRLILRSLQSPWTTPVPDFTKGSVLTHDELDNNLIYLRGESIYDVTSSSGFTTLHKINGTQLTYDNDQNNFIKSKVYVATVSADTVTKLVNYDPTGLIIDDKTNYFIRVQQGSFDLIYGFVSGKGNWGMSWTGGTGTMVEDSDFILLNSTTGSTILSPWKVGSANGSIEPVDSISGASVASGVNSLAQGSSNIATSLGEINLGLYSNNVSGSSSTWVATDRLFNLGNGTGVNDRSDAFTVYKEGNIIAPSLTPDMILSGDGKSLVTKEYLTAFSGLSSWNYVDSLGPDYGRTPIQTDSIFHLGRVKIGDDTLPEGNSLLDVDGDVYIGGGQEMYMGNAESLIINARSETWAVGVRNLATQENSDFFIGLNQNQLDAYFTIEPNGSAGFGTATPGGISNTTTLTISISGTVTKDDPLLLEGLRSGDISNVPNLLGVDVNGVVKSIDTSFFTGGSGSDLYWISGSSGTDSLTTIANLNSGGDATGNYSTASGYYTAARGNASHAEGSYTTASGTYSHSEGYYSTASGDYGAHAEGISTEAIGDSAHAEGKGSTASGNASHAEGQDTLASGYASHAEGGLTTASGQFTHAEGNSTEASGYASHAEGFLTIASGNYSHVGGKGLDYLNKIVASGDTSFAHFKQTTTSGVIGAYGDNSAILGGIDHNILSGATNSAIIGGSAITADQPNTVYVPQLNITDIVEEFTGNTSLTIDDQGNVKKYNQNVLFRGTWAELEAIRAASGLTTGRKFILTDYVHKYQINGSDSKDIGQLHTMIGISGNYTQFNSVPSNVANNGDVVEIVSVPSGSTRTPGTLVTIVDYYNDGYIRFSPTITSPTDVGTVFKFSKQRYSNVPSNATILDAYGKPVLKPDGVINTEVHDGMPYMDMTGDENPAPIVEEIVLTALDESTFSTKAESLTFVGDQLEYLFDATTINDEDGNLITGVTRNGFIIRRMNESLGINVNKDWRNQRYRRYKIDDDNWTNMLLKGDNASLYTYNNRNHSSTVNNSLDEGHKYSIKSPEEANFYLDFYSSGNTDIFLSGETSTPSVQAGGRMAVDIPPYLKDVILPTSGLTSAIDYHIIPIEDYEPTDLITTFNVDKLNNSVFKGLNQVYGLSRNIYVINNSSIVDSTINTGGVWTTNGNLSNILSIDVLDIRGDGDIRGLFNSNFTELSNNGNLVNVRFGGYFNVGENSFMGLEFDSNTTVINTIIGVSRNDNLLFNNFICNRSLIQGDVFRQCKFTGSMYCTNINSSGALTSTHFNIHNFNKKVLNKPLFGTKHIIPSSLNNITIDDNNAKSDLVTRITDENYITTITQIGTTQ